MYVGVISSRGNAAAVLPTCICDMYGLVVLFIEKTNDGHRLMLLFIDRV